MDKNQKLHILHQCNIIPIDSLDATIKEGHITIEEFIQYNLEIAKVNELKIRKGNREGVFEKQEEVKKPKISGSTGSEPNRKTVEIQKVLNNEISVSKRENDNGDSIQECIEKKIYTYQDLIENGISEEVVKIIKNIINNPINIKSYNVGELDEMESGRTDVFFIGLPAAGKSTMLGGLLKYAHKNGILLSDSYNPAGNVYQEQLVSNIEKGVLPKGTAEGSYNYIATSIEDRKGNPHPFNIVEVPGENYKKIHDYGIETEEVKGFVNHIKNNNKKILIFVIDSLAHDKDDRGLNQSFVYPNILSMLKNNGILNKTDAIYLVANKFDVIKKDRYNGINKSDLELADEFLENEFKSLIKNCQHARKEVRKEFKIRVLPFSIGAVLFDKVLEKYTEEYSKTLMNYLLEDSFVPKGGIPWKKIF
jgi:hypothetical protein